jgi:hypothetical protein
MSANSLQLLGLKAEMDRLSKEGFADSYKANPQQQPKPIEQGGSFALKTFDLNTGTSDAFGTDQGENVVLEGYSLQYLRDGSSPFGRV